MGTVESTRETVESYLAELGEEYESFSVNQTTLSVSAGRFVRESELLGAGQINVYTKVTNDGEILQMNTDEDSLDLPSATAATVEAIEEAAQSAVAEAAGIQCSLQGVEQATILGIRNADDSDCETVYSLAVVFEASYDGGHLEGDVVWKNCSERELVYA